VVACVVAAAIEVAVATLMVAAMVVVVHHINSSNATAPTPPHPMTQDQPAKSVTRRGT
jgi:hypothetical protein